MSDKRSVFTDALETLGTIIDETQKRDAIHLAVEPVVAKNYLRPGEHVTAYGIPCYPYGKDAVGIVDPFVIGRVGELGLNMISPGERFWLVLYPRTIKSLRHVWEHPAFPPSELQDIPEVAQEESEVGKSKKWMEDYAEKLNKAVLENRETYDEDEDDRCPITYEKIMKAARDFVESGEEFGKGYDFFNEELPDEFWPHYEVITGTKVDNHADFLLCCV